MKMDRGPSYTEYEDVVRESRDNNGQPAHSSEGLVKRINVPITTGRIMDRKDKMFQRSKGQWKYVADHLMVADTYHVGM